MCGGEAVAVAAEVVAVEAAAAGVDAVDGELVAEAAEAAASAVDGESVVAAGVGAAAAVVGARCDAVRPHAARCDLPPSDGNSVSLSAPTTTAAAGAGGDRCAVADTCAVAALVVAAPLLADAAANGGLDCACFLGIGRVEEEVRTGRALAILFLRDRRDPEAAAAHNLHWPINKTRNHEDHHTHTVQYVATEKRHLAIRFFVYVLSS